MNRRRLWKTQESAILNGMYSVFTGSVLLDRVTKVSKPRPNNGNGLKILAS
jgi:hypothetical protein